MKKLILLFLIAFQTATSIGQIKKPNIIVILSDDHTQQAISAYGSRLMQTPNIDRIANEGALFKNSFVTNSICAPSRAVFLTGKYSHLNGLRDNSPKRNFNGSQQQVQKLLHEQQYQTAWIGKWHLQSYPQGFDFWKVLPEQGNYYQPDFVTMNHDTVRTTGYVTNVISDFSIDWLNKRDTSNPFFLVIGEKATHRNWMPAIEDLGSFDNQTFPMPENFWDDYTNRTAASKQDMTVNKTMVIKDDLKIGADYNLKGMFGRLSASEKQAYEKYYVTIAKEYAQIKNDSIALIKWKYQRYLKDYLSTAKSLDRNIGRILNYLDSTKLDKNTIVIYTSDQGFYMGEHGWFDKRFMYEESLRTPLVMRYPGMIKAGTKINEMVVNIDLAPSLLGFANSPIPTDIQGKNFKTLFEKKPLIIPWRKSIYYHYYEYPQPHQVAPHFGVRTEKYKLIRFYGPHNDWELFDLTNDKTEMHNLISVKKYQPIILQLKKELKDLIIQFKDTEALTILESQQ